MTVQELINILQDMTPEQKALPVYTHETGAIAPADEVAQWETLRAEAGKELDYPHSVIWIGS